MTFQHDADGVSPGDEAEGAPSGISESGGSDESAEHGDSDGSPQHSRALLALIAGGTVAVAPVANTVLAPAGAGYAAHSSPAYVLAELSHDIGHNDWAFQGGLGGRVIWAVTYVALALAWLFVALWMRMRDRRAARAAAADGRPRPKRLWLKTWGAVLAVEFAAGVLTIGAALYAQWTATSLGPIVLRLADVCSPWWSCVVAVVVVARAERDRLALRAATAYGAMLALVLLVPLPGPSDLKALILAATAAVPALLDGGAKAAAVQAAADPVQPEQLSPGQIKLRSDAAATG